MVITINLDTAEQALATKLKMHKFLKEIQLISEKMFIQMLLQRRFISLSNTMVYDLIIDALMNVDAKKIIRKIVREQYTDASGNTPSVFENQIRDLLVIGVSREEILKSYPTLHTKKTIDNIVELVRKNSVIGFSDLPLLTILRFWGHVLVSEEYSILWIRMSNLFFQTSKTKSLFYYPLYAHNSRESLECPPFEPQTYSGEIGNILCKLIRSDKEKNLVLDTEEIILKNRLMFYDQF